MSTLFEDRPKAKTAAQPTTAGALTGLLRNHYLSTGRPPGGIFAAEIGSPCGKRRADALWFPTTIAGGRGLVGHEIKVTRSDVLAELADPSKADPWAQFCTRWWLVVAHPSLVEGLDIPEAWGIMAPPSGRRTRSMTVVRPAPELDPVDRTRGVERLLAWLFYRMTDERLALEQRLREELRTVEHLRRRADELQVTGGRRGQLEEHVAKVVLAYRGRAEQDDDLRYRGGGFPEVEDVVDALIDHARMHQAAARLRDNVTGRVTALDNLLRPLRDSTYSKALKDIAKGLDGE